VKRIYLDNAATSWPKPEAVYAAVDRYQRDNGAAAGRGSYSHAAAAEKMVEAARAALARIMGASDSRQIIFTNNGTDSLNLAIHGLLRPGDHAICTHVDHNSVLRPLRFLEEHGGVEVTRVGCDQAGLVDPDDIRRALRSNTRLVAAIHASNVTGLLQPVAEIGRVVRERGARLLVDAAQTLGHIPLSVDELGADLLAAPGHKGLLGPLGTGVLYVRPGVEKELRSFRQGGTGTQSDEDRHPDPLPHKFEAGNLNVPGIVGLRAALSWIEEHGIDNIREQEQRLSQRLRRGFEAIPGIRTIAFPSPDAVDHSVGVVSIALEHYDPQEAAALLDSGFGVQVRAGLHCAPLMHRALGTIEGGGTVRFSVGAFNTADDVDLAVAAVAEMTKELLHK
jgi:cysteine desulfurase / selenocysteine lyase